MDLLRKLALRRATTVTVEAPAPTPDPHEEAHAERLTRLRTMLDQMIARQKARDKTEPPSPLAPQDRPRKYHLRTGPLPGALRETEHGPIHVVLQTLETHHCHGKVPVASALRARGETIAKLALDPSLAGIDPRGFLYLDTETTGLMGGTGTLAFLLGLAWFEDESLVLEQILLRTPADEPAMLRHLLERLKKASAIVTYNGKSFDWPLIKSRFVMNRMEVPPDPPHLDLVHAARRVFRRRLGEVRLTTLERALLGFRREHDVDGHEIPALYWAMIRSADSSMLTPVVEHNANDLVALAGVLAILSDRFENLRSGDDPSDHLGFAHTAARAADPERASLFAHAAATGGGDAPTTLAALVLSARLAIRRRDHAEAARLYAEALGHGAPHEIALVHLCLAKLYEHQLADPMQAQAHAAFTAPAEGFEKHDKRRARLVARCAKKGLSIS